MKHLIQEQRYEIYLALKRGWSKSRIAREIGVATSTVCREIERNSNSRGEYVWLSAQSKSESRKHGLKGNHRKPPELWWRIEQMIVEEDWSPAQIAGVLRREGTHIAKQTIYNHVHADTSGRLAAHMPHELKYTRRIKTLRPTKATNIANRTSIHQRPAEADGSRFGDWEMDTIVDSYGHVILTLTERSTNFILMQRLQQGKKALPTAHAVARLLFPYRNTLKTLDGIRSWGRSRPPPPLGLPPPRGVRNDYQLETCPIVAFLFGIFRNLAVKRTPLKYAAIRRA